MIKYCWFAGDVTASLLMVENKIISLLLQLNSIFMQILRKKFYCIDSQHDQRVTWLQTKNIFTDKFGTSQLNWAFCGFQNSTNY